MVRTLVAGEFFEGEEMKADEREKVNLNAHVSRKHLTRQGAAVSLPSLTQSSGYLVGKKLPIEVETTKEAIKHERMEYCFAILLLIIDSMEMKLSKVESRTN